jgi:L-amino acid N-acyltransferase YncA
MEYSVRPLGEGDRQAVIDIFNYYIEHSFAAYREEKVSPLAFDRFLQMSRGYPSAVLTNPEGRVIGFGLLHAYSEAATFAHTAEVTYFIHPDHIGKGLGNLLLDTLESGARDKGISKILANVSSLNETSIRFHLKHGFEEVGRLKAIGRKHGREFDTLWLEKVL